MRGYHTTVPVTAEYAYDHLGRVTDIAAGTGVDFHYDYVANENNIWKKRFDHRNGSPYNEYGYDDIDRLAGVTYLNSETEGFVMDDLGNRTGIQTLRGGGTDDYSVDSLTNRYTAIDASPLGYDDAGNLTQDKDGYVYGYDYENRIVEIRNSADAVIARMDYDTQGRRIRVHDAAAGTTTFYFYSDNWQVLQEHNGTSFTAYYVLGNYIDEVLLMHRAGADVFYLHDHLYSPVALLNTTGSVVERFEYDAYGKASILSSDFSPLTSSAYGNRILFTGREVDSLDNGSLPLQYNRHRYLSQYMGRWYSHDPLGYVDGISLYEYVRGIPSFYVDPFGLSRTSPVIATPIRLAFSVPYFSDLNGYLDGYLFQSRWCCKSGKHKGQNQWVRETKVSGSVGNKYEYNISDLLSRSKNPYAYVASYLVSALGTVTGSKAEVGIEVSASGKLNARYDGCEEKIMMANGSFSIVVMPYGKIQMGGTLPLKQIGNTLGPYLDLIGVNANTDWENYDLPASVSGDLSATFTANPKVTSTSTTVELRSDLSVSFQGQSSFTINEWVQAFSFATPTYTIPESLIASYSF